MNGMVALSGDIIGGTKQTGNLEALTVDWGGLAVTNAGFLAIVLHAYEGKLLSDVKGCLLSCEWKGQVFFDHGCSDVQGSGFFWGFAFKDDTGMWWFLEMNAVVSGYS